MRARNLPLARLRFRRGDGNRSAAVQICDRCLVGAVCAGCIGVPSGGEGLNALVRRSVVLRVGEVVVTLAPQRSGEAGDVDSTRRFLLLQVPAGHVVSLQFPVLAFEGAVLLALVDVRPLVSHDAGDRHRAPIHAPQLFGQQSETDHDSVVSAVRVGIGSLRIFESVEIGRHIEGGCQVGGFAVDGCIERRVAGCLEDDHAFGRARRVQALGMCVARKKNHRDNGVKEQDQNSQRPSLVMT